MTFRAIPCWLVPLLAVLGPVQEATAAATSCSVQIAGLTRIEPQDDYDPFAGATVPGYHRFQLRHLNGPACRVAVTIDDGDNGNRVMTRAGSALDYDLFKDASLSTPVSGPDGSPSGWMTASIGTNGLVDMEVFSVIPPGQLAGSGRHMDRVRVEVYLLEDGLPGRRLATRQIQVRADVVESVQTVVTIDGSERPLTGGVVGTLDFGDMQSGSTRAFQLDVRGNTDYQVTLESENQGRLLGSAGSIPYSLSVDGQRLGLGGPATLSYTNARARSHSVVVSVGDIGRALAGTYQDNLCLTVTAR